MTDDSHDILEQLFDAVPVCRNNIERKRTEDALRRAKSATA